MKKTYIKPHVLFEDFEITSRIAAACGDAWMDHVNSQWGLFNSPIDGCTEEYDPAIDGPGYEGLCYHTIDAIYGS